MQDKAAAHGKKPPAPAAAGKGAESKGSAKTGGSGEEHDKKLAEGLSALDAVTARYARDGATKDEIVTGVKSVRRKFTVFKSIEVVDGGETWDYLYVASNGTQRPGTKKKKDRMPLLKGEGEVDEYNSLEFATGTEDHHVPQKALMADFSAALNSDYTEGAGIAIKISTERHKGARTTGRKRAEIAEGETPRAQAGKKGKGQQTAMDELKADMNNLRNDIFKEKMDEQAKTKERKTIKEHIKSVETRNRARFSKIFAADTPYEDVVGKGRKK